ncbi:1-deoxy-D-xylulose-5-phosphate synthase [Desulfitispora alkaliphila]
MKSELLQKINSPNDLKKLSFEQVDQLAGEIREFLVNSVSSTGGHLGPNLGVVELTLAIHYAYNSPKDKLIWDVGHQSYVHKLITGRRDQFGSLRQYGGLSGFPKREESKYDNFNTGHSSTSISAALGMAKARDIRGTDEEVVAVIGDGALTGGMAFEALNHAGHLDTNITVILNDNEMSIASNVGAMSSYLSRLRTDPMYDKGKDEIEYLLKKIPAIGSRVVKVVERLKDSLKYLVVPGMLFEELGFTYFGQIDGHDFDELQAVLKRSKKIKGPKLIHVITTKGKGYKPAEARPEKFHGVGAFQVSTGEIKKKKTNTLTYTQAFSHGLLKLAEQNSKIISITAAMPDGTGLNEFSLKYPKRFFDVGIAEQHAVTMAAGMAADGYKPVVAVYSTFLQRAYDQVIHDVCMQNLPVVFALDRAGLVGEDGETHHGVFDLSYLSHIPNMTVMVPKDEAELQHMLHTALKMDSPVAIRYPRGNGEGVENPEVMQELPYGKGELLLEGTDLTIVAAGYLAYTAVEVAKKLSEQGITATVINPRFVKPFDRELILDWADKTEYVVTIEDNLKTGGFGSSVLQYLHEENSNVKVMNIGIGDEFVQQGNVNIIREQVGLDQNSIVQQILDKKHFKRVK